jgi:MraZ protein
LFTGKHDRSLDDKWRLVLPTAFRRPFEDGGGRLAPGDRCLALFTEDEFKGVMQRMVERSRSEEADDEIAEAVRLFTGSTVPVQLDGQGRFVVGEEHRDYAGLTREVLVVGQNDRVEIWDAASYRALEAAKPAADVSATLRRMRVF